MKQIKFRAWDKVKGKMLDEILLEDDDCFGEFSLCRLNKCLIETSLELMQFTGLLDKNGKEIYEGDIVKHYDGRKYYEVKWNEKSARFEYGGFPFRIPGAIKGDSAFTVAELGDELEKIEWENLKMKYTKEWESLVNEVKPFQKHTDTEANNRAKMLIYLLENKLV